MSLWIHALACAFGLGSWVAVNGLWVELPLIVTVLPEGWDLPSHLTVIIQLANLGPLLVTLGHRVCPGRVREAPVVAGVLSLGVVACVLLAFLWRRTSWLLGAERSAAFFALTFFLALVDCTSSVTFLPFMMQLPAKYVTSYFVGEGLSGLVPGLVALAQGVGMARCVNISESGSGSSSDFPNSNGSSGVPGGIQTEYLEPNFSTEVFFGFLAIMTAVSLGAFLALNRLPRVYRLSSEHLVPPPEGEGKEEEGVSTVCARVGPPPSSPPPKTPPRSRRRPRPSRRRKREVSVAAPCWPRRATARVRWRSSTAWCSG